VKKSTEEGFVRFPEMILRNILCLVTWCYKNIQLCLLNFIFVHGDDFIDFIKVIIVLLLLYFSLLYLSSSFREVKILRFFVYFTISIYSIHSSC